METYSSINAYGYHSPYQYDPPSLHWCSRWSYSMPHTQINTMSDQLLAIQENLTRVLVQVESAKSSYSRWSGLMDSISNQIQELISEESSLKHSSSSTDCVEHLNKKVASELEDEVSNSVHKVFDENSQRNVPIELSLISSTVSHENSLSWVPTQNLCPLPHPKVVASISPSDVELASKLVDAMPDRELFAKFNGPNRTIVSLFHAFGLYNCKWVDTGQEQKFLIGVILMVPCYAVESFVSLVNPSISVGIGILRDCYESFAMYCFGRYLVACLGGEERAIIFMEREGRAASKMPLLEHGSEKGVVKHPFPMNYFLKPWKLGQWVYQVIKFGIVQYMIIKAFTALLAVILEAFDVYCEGDFKWNCGYPYVAVVLNFSQSWALYCLVQFYTITKNELAHIKPLYKFLTFKSIVFLTWWQGVAIALLCTLGLFRSPIAEALQFKSSIQDFIICIEMGVASAVHLYVFPAKPYELMGERYTGAVAVLGDYVSADLPVDPEEVIDSERPTKLRLPQPDIDDRGGMTIRESVKDVFIGGGEYIVNDLKFTVTQAVEPVEKGIQKLHKISQNIKKHEKEKRTKDDSCIATSSPARRVIRGIDDPLLHGSVSDSGTSRKKKHRKKSGYTSAESGGESSSDQSFGGIQVRGRRWVTKD